VACTLLIHSEIVVFYEFPSYLSSKDEEFVKSVIDIIRLNHTVVMFSATNTCDSIADKIYTVDGGKVMLLKDNSNNTNKSIFDMLENYENSRKFSKSNRKNGLNNLLKRYIQENIGNNHND
jgi:energy-coupling factor transporter ATP-binding protein EcfA2